MSNELLINLIKIFSVTQITIDTLWPILASVFYGCLDSIGVAVWCGYALRSVDGRRRYFQVIRLRCFMFGQIALLIFRILLLNR